MGQVIVRNLDDRVVESLKLKAELHGRSLEQELRDILTKAAGLTPDEKIEMARQIRAMSRGKLKTDSTVFIREDRNRR